jgi:hypothetical protein
MEFDFEIPPLPTVVKGLAMSPEPTIRFKLPESEDYRALQKMFQVTCTLADVHHVEKGIKPNDLGFAKFQEQLSGANAPVQYDGATNSYQAVFSNLKINVSGYQVFENGKFKKKSKSHFATRYLIFIINFSAPNTAPVVIFQQNFAVDVYPSSCNIGMLRLLRFLAYSVRTEGNIAALCGAVNWSGRRGEQSLCDGLWVRRTVLRLLWRVVGTDREPRSHYDEMQNTERLCHRYVSLLRPLC